MGRPITNMKNYERILRRNIDEHFLAGLSKLDVYAGILKTIDKEHNKLIKKIDTSSEKRKIVLKLLREEKERITGGI